MWSYDFVDARTHNGRSLRLLTLIDEFSRECLAIRVARRLNSAHVIELLGECMLQYGTPEHIRSDNTAEMTARRALYPVLAAAQEVTREVSRKSSSNSHADGASENFTKRLWFGVILGVPLTSDLRPPPFSPPPYTGPVTRTADFPFVGGIMGEFRMSLKSSIEIESLYRRLRFRESPDVVLTWEFPILAKYKLSSRRFAPFVAAGPVFRATGNLNNVDPSHWGIDPKPKNCTSRNWKIHGEEASAKV